MAQSPHAPAEVFEAFVEGRLAKDEWTHEAHLIACWKALETRSPSEALTFLRAAITAHNCGVGTPNDEADGYHETITRYYITAVSESGATNLDEVMADPRCSRTGALEFWSEEVLMGSEARLGWVPPDRTAPPWPIVAD